MRVHSNLLCGHLLWACSFFDVCAVCVTPQHHFTLSSRMRSYRFTCQPLDHQKPFQRCLAPLKLQGTLVGSDRPLYGQGACRHGNRWSTCCAWPWGSDSEGCCIHVSDEPLRNLSGAYQSCCCVCEGISVSVIDAILVFSTGSCLICQLCFYIFQLQLVSSACSYCFLFL